MQPHRVRRQPPGRAPPGSAPLTPPARLRSRAPPRLRAHPEGAWEPVPSGAHRRLRRRAGAVPGAGRAAEATGQHPGQLLPRRRRPRVVHARVRGARPARRSRQSCTSTTPAWWATSPIGSATGWTARGCATRCARGPRPIPVGARARARPPGRAGACPPAGDHPARHRACVDHGQRRGTRRPSRTFATAATASRRSRPARGRPRRPSWRRKCATGRPATRPATSTPSGRCSTSRSPGRSRRPIPPRVRRPTELRPACPQRDRADRPSCAAAAAGVTVLHGGGDAGGLRLRCRDATTPPRRGSGPSSSADEDRARWEKRLRRALGDDYELLDLLGTGGFGRVYRVRDLHLERVVALKVLHPALDPRPERGRAVPARGAARRPAQPPQHRQHLRDRRPVGADLVHDGADRRAQPGPAGERDRAAAAGPGAPAAARGALRAGARSRLGPGASGHQAGEHADRAGREPADHRLRPGARASAESSGAPPARAEHRSSPVPSSSSGSGWTSAPTCTAWPRSRISPCWGGRRSPASRRSRCWRGRPPTSFRTPSSGARM